MSSVDFKELIPIFIISVLVAQMCCDSVTKEITINGIKHQIMGTTLSIDGVNVDYFARIPYALPPVGPLRFKYPQDIKGASWTGLYNATVQPNTCWQADGGEFDKLNPAARMWLTKTPYSEDCLYLSIWAPGNTSSEKLSVMVWIYGGSFLSGSSTLEVYDGSVLAARNKVIVVSMQYRLGPLGFMYLDDTLVPGNQGLMDQQMALKWVKSNVNNFNGDDNKITIFGESAGSASVSLHVLSPTSKNLFNRAIMESGTALSPWVIETKEESKTKAIELAKYVNCASFVGDMNKLIDCFIKADPSDLSNLQFNLKELATKQRVELLKKRGVLQLITDGSYFVEFYFKPIYDNYFLPKDITTLLLQSKTSSSKVDLLMGFNANEGVYFLLYGLNKWLNILNKGDILIPSRLNSSDPNLIKASKLIIESLSSPQFSYKSLMPLLMYEYLVPEDTMGDKQWTSLQVMSAFDQMVADELFVCPVVGFAETMAENQQNVYLYNFRHQTDNVTFPKWVGTMHGYEIEYVFGMPFSSQFKSLYYSFSEDEKTLSDAVMKMLTNFAKYGNPTPSPVKYFDQNVSWLPYNNTVPTTFHFSISKDVPFRINPKSRQCRFWTKVLPALIEEFNKVTVSKASNIVTKSLVVLLTSLLISVINIW